MTAIREAMQKAGITPPEEALAAAADAAYASAPNNFRTASDALLAILSADAALCFEAFRAHHRTVVTSLLREAAERAKTAIREKRSAARQRTEGATLATRTQQQSCHPSDRNPGGDGRVQGATRMVTAIASRDTTGIGAITRVASQTLFDTLIIGGKAIGDWTTEGLEDLGRRLGAEAWFVTQLRTGMPYGAKVRDVHKVAAVEDLWTRARALNGVEIRP